MRVSFVPPHPDYVPGEYPASSPIHAPDAPSPRTLFRPFSAEAFSQAHLRGVPVFLIIGDPDTLPPDPSLCMQLHDRTIPVHLHPGERPDVELLCQRAGVLFSQDGALPLCALLLSDTRPFLAASLPPSGFPIDPVRLYTWLAYADRRFAQNPSAFHAQAAQVIHSFKAAPLKKPYSPSDAAHDLSQALHRIQDAVNGGFGQIKFPFVCALHFLQHAASSGDKSAYASLSRTLDAMLSSALYDPIDGAFFRSTLTADWRVFLPEKPLGVNAMLAQILLACSRRSEAIRLLDFIVSAFPLSDGGLSAMLRTDKDRCSFSSEQICAALGSEDGLKACRLLGLLHQHGREDPLLTPSRFSPPPPDKAGRRLSMELPARCPTFPAEPSPEDSSFLRRILPALFRIRAARNPQQPVLYVITEHCALAAAILAQCGRKLGEPQYTQAAQRAVTFLISLPPASSPSAPLPPTFSPCSMLHAQATCASTAALALALLTLGQSSETYAQSGLRLLGAALHAFIRQDGVPMYTQADPAAWFPRVPAIYDSELPSPAALLVRALCIADHLRPDAHYQDVIHKIWDAAAPYVKAQPLSCAALIDAMTDKNNG